MQNTLRMERKDRDQEEVLAHTTINWEVQSYSTMK